MTSARGSEGRSTRPFRRRCKPSCVPIHRVPPGVRCQGVHPQETERLDPLEALPVVPDEALRCTKPEHSVRRLRRRVGRAIDESRAWVKNTGEVVIAHRPSGSMRAGVRRRDSVEDRDRLHARGQHHGSHAGTYLQNSLECRCFPGSESPRRTILKHLDRRSPSSDRTLRRKMGGNVPPGRGCRRRFLS